MNKLIVILFLCIVFADYGGGHAGSGFRYGSNARQFSLANASVADSIGVFHAFSNPALFHYAQNPGFGFSYQSMSLDRSIGSIAFIDDLPPSAGFGVAVLWSGTDKIQGKNAMNEPTDTFSSQEIQTVISFGISLMQKISLGINTKIFFADNYNNRSPQKARGLGLDFGLIYKYNENLVLGYVLENFGTKYNWNSGVYPNYTEEFPYIMKLGLHYKTLKNINIFMQEDIYKTQYSNINYRLKLGLEYHIKNNINIRFGLSQKRGARGSNNISKNNYKPVFGIGAPIKIMNRHFIQVDYALDPGNVGEGLSHLFCFSIKMQSQK
tara:strand:+ start:5148 stop:6116 length:969 start_codon:yes stop_codon:yes gene_type:complete